MLLTELNPAVSFQPNLGKRFSPTIAPARKGTGIQQFDDILGRGAVRATHDQNPKFPALLISACGRGCVKTLT